MQVYPQWAYSFQDHHDRDSSPMKEKQSTLLHKGLYIYWHYISVLHYGSTPEDSLLKSTEAINFYLRCSCDFSLNHAYQLKTEHNLQYIEAKHKNKQKYWGRAKVPVSIWSPNGWPTQTNLDCREHNPQPPRPPRLLQPCPSSAAPCGSTRHPSLLPRPPCSVLLTLALEFCNTTYILTSNLILQYCINALN